MRSSMVVEITTAEQHVYLRRDKDLVATLHALFPQMPNGPSKRVCIVEGGYCSDTRYTDKVQEKEDQHQTLQSE